MAWLLIQSDPEPTKSPAARVAERSAVASRNSVSESQEFGLRSCQEILNRLPPGRLARILELLSAPDSSEEVLEAQYKELDDLLGDRAILVLTAIARTEPRVAYRALFQAKKIDGYGSLLSCFKTRMFKDPATPQLSQQPIRNPSFRSAMQSWVADPALSQEIRSGAIRVLSGDLVDPAIQDLLLSQLNDESGVAGEVVTALSWMLTAEGSPIKGDASLLARAAPLVLGSIHHLDSFRQETAISILGRAVDHVPTGTLDPLIEMLAGDRIHQGAAADLSYVLTANLRTDNRQASVDSALRSYRRFDDAEYRMGISRLVFYAAAEDQAVPALGQLLEWSVSSQERSQILLYIYSVPGSFERKRNDAIQLLREIAVDPRYPSYTRGEAADYAQRLLE
jgi:hypothetical protein